VDADAAHPRRDQRRDPEREVKYLPTCLVERDAAHPRNPPREAQKNKQKRREQ